MKPPTTARLLLLAVALCVATLGCDGLVVTQQKYDVPTLAKSWPPYQAPQLAAVNQAGDTNRQPPTSRGPSPVLAAPMPQVRPHTEWSLPETALDALGRMGTAAVPELIVGLLDPDPQQRANAARVLARIGPDASGAVPALITALSDPELQVRQAAARALGQVGPEARPAVRPLIQIMRDLAPATAP